MMETPYDAIVTFFVFNFGLVLSLLLSKWLKISTKMGVFLYIWHTVFSFIYFNYILNYGGDAFDYYLKSLTIDNNETLQGYYLGSGMIVRLVEPFSSLLTMPFIAVNLLFNIFGSIGLLAFYASLMYAVGDRGKYGKILARIIVLLPSISYWTSAVGKDSLFFMGVGLLLWSYISLRERLAYAITSLLIIFLVRPHMGGLIIASLVMSIFFKKNVNIAYRTAILASSLGLLFALFPYITKYVGLNDASSSSDVMEYIETRQEYNQSGGGGIDISQMSYPMKMFTYMFRPLPNEAASFSSLMASVDNTFILIVFCFGFYWFFKNNNINKRNYYFLIIYGVLGWSILAMTTANLGIAVRQKWMIIPFFFFVFLFSMYSYKKRTRF